MSEQKQSEKPQAPARGGRVGATLRTRAFRMGTYSVAVALIVIAIAFAVNLVVSKLPATATQLDMTEQGIFTLAEQTKSIVADSRAPSPSTGGRPERREDSQL